MVYYRENVIGDMEGYERLAHAVILKACRDYRKALKSLLCNPENDDALREKISIEQFFRSPLYEILTDLDPEMLISRLQKEVRAK